MFKNIPCRSFRKHISEFVPDGTTVFWCKTATFKDSSSLNSYGRLMNLILIVFISFRFWNKFVFDFNFNMDNRLSSEKWFNCLGSLLDCCDLSHATNWWRVKIANRTLFEKTEKRDLETFFSKRWWKWIVGQDAARKEWANKVLPWFSNEKIKFR